MFESIRPLTNPPLGGHWQGNTLKFGLVATAVNCIRYCFYEHPSPDVPLLEQSGEYRSLWADVFLDTEFQFGDVWGWEAEIVDCPEEALNYLIQIEKTDGTTHFIFDPYAKESSGGEKWGKPLGFEVSPEDFSLRFFLRSHGPGFPGIRRLSVLRPEDSGNTLFDSPLFRTERSDRPNYSLEQSIVYECHLRGMTRSPSANSQFSILNSQFSGTYQGLTACIPYLKALGVTAVELLPIFDFDENESPFTNPESGQPLLNYWGYSPLLFFAPKQNYAADLGNSPGEFQNMVEQFHQAGLEIWLDVVFNHTAELGKDGPSDHFKNLAPEQYYLLEKDSIYNNYSGCGNTLYCAHPTVRRLIRECLYYWANVMNVDGFRFDLAAILNRDVSGNLSDFPQCKARFLWELRNDPLLKNVKLIAEPWDAAGGYELGKAARHANWAEWNDRYRDTVRRAVCGVEGMMGALKQAILGSPDIFASVRKGGRASVNYITSHDGMTLMDLVSYNGKHNEANGENNRDGHNAEFSNNCGVEGKTENPEILNLRFRKLRLFHCLLQISNGIPMLTGGDEFGRTQQGNNNAYCHDSALTWLDWALAEQNAELLTFTRRMIAFRKQHTPFLFAEKSAYRWFNATGDTEDLAAHVRTLHAEITNPQWPEQTLRVLINCFDQPVKFEVPKKVAWRVLIDTDKKPSEYVPPLEGNAWLAGFTVQILRGIAGS